MEDLRDILAANLKKNRRRLGISQPQLAETADLSTHYVAMIETSRKFPTPEVLARLAKALGIPPHELFAVSVSPETALERLHKEVIIDIKQVVSETVEKAIAEQCEKAIKNQHS
jgi:transcriptional regulator with XRE-family HTH domain